MTTAALKISDLNVSYQQEGRWFDALRGVSLQIAPGQTYGLVGESGSGKSTLALSVIRFLSENGRVRSGKIELAGRDVMSLTDAELREFWRKCVKLVPQNPLPSLNPSLRIGRQLREAIYPPLNAAGANLKVLELLESVGMADPKRIARAYPHQLSGGMQQRVVIAMALASEPDLLILDEPTTNLDVTTEATILDLIRDLIKDRNTAVLYVSHSLGVVAQICDRVAVLYGGELVEDADVLKLYRKPLHPYTQGLLDSVPRIGQDKTKLQLRPIPGQIPGAELPSGCIFAPRCPLAIEICRSERPKLELPWAGRRVRCHRWQEIADNQADPRQPLKFVTASEVPNAEVETVLKLSEVKKRFAVQRSLSQVLRQEAAKQVRAVDGIDLSIGRGKTLGLVGESGSGKSTLARCIVGLVPRSEGDISLLDIPLARTLSARDKTVLRSLQMVLQSPDEALNPYLRVDQTLRRPLQRLAGLKRQELDQAVVNLLKAVKLSPSYAERLPGQLSGGEKQRVSIARAFASQPDLLLFDESVSALDVSVQAAIVNLLSELQQEHQSSYLFISHDLSVVSYLADEIAVMYLGVITEIGKTQDVLKPPYHPYTEALLSAIPLIDPEAAQEHIRLVGEVPSPVNLPTGCRFHTRCPRFLGKICGTTEPPWQEDESGKRINCHIPLSELKTLQKQAFNFDHEEV